jgi:glycerate kinase
VSKALCAPDSFKGTLSAAQVAAALAEGVRRAGSEADALPLADGGEGTARALLAALSGKTRTARASDPLGREIEAEYALLADGRAVVEVAAASGLTLVAEEERDAWAASSRGTGELIAAAVASGAPQVVVAAGGSATTDGGAGALEAVSEAGVEPALVVLCDVRIPFERAASVFAPQKGADEQTVRRLEERLDRFAQAAPRDPRGVPSTGAAGGLAGGLWAHLGAELVAGAPWLLDQLGFDRRLDEASLVLTGEGRLDPTSAAGKLVGEVAGRCRRAEVPCCAVVGELGLSAREAGELGLTGVREAGDAEAIAAAAAELASTCTSP